MCLFMYNKHMLNKDYDVERLYLLSKIEDCKSALEQREILAEKISKEIDKDKMRLVEAMQALSQFERDNVKQN